MLLKNNCREFKKKRLNQISEYSIIGIGTYVIHKIYLIFVFEWRNDYINMLNTDIIQSSPARSQLVCSILNESIISQDFC